MTQLEAGPPAVEGDKPQVRLRRSTEDRMIAGVCGGLGRYFNTDPVWFRLGFVVVTFAAGVGVLIYVISWLIIPEAGPGKAPVGRTGDIGSRGSMIIGIAMVGVGLMLLANNLLPWLDRVIWPLAVIATGAGLLYLGSRREHN